MVHVQLAGLQSHALHGIFHTPIFEDGNSKPTCNERKGFRVAITARITYPNSNELLQPYIDGRHYKRVLGPDGNKTLRLWTCELLPLAMQYLEYIQGWFHTHTIMIFIHIQWWCWNLKLGLFLGECHIQHLKICNLNCLSSSGGAWNQDLTQSYTINCSRVISVRPTSPFLCQPWAFHYSWPTDATLLH